MIIEECYLQNQSQATVKIRDQYMYLLVLSFINFVMNAPLLLSSPVIKD